MRQSGEHRIEAPREQVWRALNDPEVLKRCIDGCQEMDKLSDDLFRAKIKARVGPVSADFTADIKRTEVSPPASCVLEVEVKGGAAGFAKGSARIALEPEGAATLLHYDAEGSVGGKIAQVGQRLVDGAARKTADDFFASFSADLAPPEASAEAAAAAAAQPRAWRSSLFWALPLIALAVIAAIILRR